MSANEISEAELIRKGAKCGYLRILEETRDSIGISDPRVIREIEAGIAEDSPRLKTDVAALRAISRQSLDYLRVQIQSKVDSIAQYLRSSEYQEQLKLAVPMAGDEQKSARVSQITEKAIFYVADLENSNCVKIGSRTTPEEYGAAVLKLGAMGLYPDHLGGMGWITQRFDKRRNAQVLIPVPGVRGLERMLADTGDLVRMETGVIREQDRLDFISGSETKLSHVPAWQPDPGKPNQVIGAWAVIRMRDNDPHMVVKRLDHKELAATPGFMDVDSRAKYIAQRACMREVLRMLPAAKYGMQSTVMEDLGEDVPAISAETVDSAKEAEGAQRPTVLAQIETGSPSKPEPVQSTESVEAETPDVGASQPTVTPAEDGESNRQAEAETVEVSAESQSVPDPAPATSQSNEGDVPQAADQDEPSRSAGKTGNDVIASIASANAAGNAVASDGRDSIDPGQTASRVFQSPRRRRKIM